jgi:hypothetical protein
MPSLPDLLAIVDRSGSPLRDDLVPAVARDPGGTARERALLQMIGAGFHAESGVEAGDPGQLTIVRLEDASAEPDGTCSTVTATKPDGTVTVEAPSGSRIRVVSTNDAATQARLGLTTPSLPLEFSLVAGTPTDVVVPDVGDGSTWMVELDIPDGAGSVRLCRV